jgi:hypothetical protein
MFNEKFFDVESINEKLISPKKMSEEEAQKMYQYFFTTLKKDQEKNKEMLVFLQNKENMKLILNFIL